MTRKLKKSFVKVTMLSALIVLLLLMGTVNLINFYQHRQEDLAILELLSANNGHFPMSNIFPGGFMPEGRDSGSSDPGSADPGAASSDSASADSTGYISPIITTGFNRSGSRFTAETPYETRYFSVTLDTEGTVTAIDTTQIAAVNAEEASELALSLQTAGKDSGRTGSYRYTAIETDDGGRMYIFLDCSRNQSAAQSFLTTSLVVMGAGLIILFFVAWFLSGHAIRPIADSYRKQKSFITNAGHELKTPLAVISSCTDVIEIEQGESKWTQSIRNQIDRLSSLTQELIALARMDEGTALIMADTNISEVVSDALSPFKLLAEQKGIPFVCDIAPGIRRSSNAESLQKIVGILGDNAIKYATGPISFSLQEAGSHIILRAENPADGLTAGEQESLFDRFYRGDASHSSDIPGYGLGLPLARSLAEALGGTIRAHSPDGKLLSITLRLR